MFNKERPREESIAVDQVIPIMRMQYRALIELASTEQLTELSKHINYDMITSMEKLAEPDDIEKQFFRVCKEIRDMGLADAVNRHVQGQCVDLRRQSFKTVRPDLGV